MRSGTLSGCEAGFPLLERRGTPLEGWSGPRDAGEVAERKGTAGGNCPRRTVRRDTEQERPGWGPARWLEERHVWASYSELTGGISRDRTSWSESGSLARRTARLLGETAPGAVVPGWQLALQTPADRVVVTSRALGANLSTNQGPARPLNLRSVLHERPLFLRDRSLEPIPVGKG